MSRIGKTPIPLKEGVQVNCTDALVEVTGPKGTLHFELPRGIKLEEGENELNVRRSEDTKDLKAKHGLTRSIVANMVYGVSEGYKITLELQGVGYRAESSGQKLKLNIGYSHPVEYELPEEVSVAVQENGQIVLEGCDKQAVGQTAAKIRAIRPPDAYKGKGIRYSGEEVSLKEGKSVG